MKVSSQLHDPAALPQGKVIRKYSIHNILRYVGPCNYDMEGFWVADG